MKRNIALDAKLTKPLQATTSPTSLGNRPWGELKGQIYLGGEEFIELHSARDKKLKEIPRAQLKAFKPTLERIFATGGQTAIAQAYREHGYRLHEIAAHLGVHCATVSRRLRRMERQK